MADQPIVFALANPVPEIAKKAGAAVIATGRSNMPNQINNVLAFPGIFKADETSSSACISKMCRKSNCREYYSHTILSGVGGCGGSGRRRCSVTKQQISLRVASSSGVKVPSAANLDVKLVIHTKASLRRAFSSFSAACTSLRPANSSFANKLASKILAMLVFLAIQFLCRGRDSNPHEFALMGF